MEDKQQYDIWVWYMKMGQTRYMEHDDKHQIWEKPYVQTPL
jgi:hypothetical protein